MNRKAIAQMSQQKDYRGLHALKVHAAIKEEHKWVDAFGFSGHASIEAKGKKIIGAKKTREQNAKQQLIASTIIVRPESCVINFEVSGEFEIGIREEKKRRNPTNSNLIHGMHFPSFKALSPDLKQKMHFFNPSEIKINKKLNKLQILIDREEGSMSFTINGRKSDKKIFVEQLAKQNAWDHPRLLAVFVELKTSAAA